MGSVSECGETSEITVPGRRLAMSVASNCHAIQKVRKQEKQKKYTCFTRIGVGKMS